MSATDGSCGAFAEAGSGEGHGLKMHFGKRKSPSASVCFLGRMQEGKETVTTDQGY